ncbi:Dihydrolipoyllysine-residue acetyltransferase component of pyruvate dehydrogenase complex [Buchnera aphidicola (Sipha maydis)]|uniref:2-oxo acid dehydrogenase subunit E2 n=1 Tax=Buchnera aphidicola TaxID=9 RepID=UPI00346405F3
MNVVIKVPDIGIEEAEVIEVLVKINDEVNVDQGLIIVEGQKASIEVPSLYHGIIKSIDVKIGDIVKIDSPIVTLKIFEKKNQKEDINNFIAKNKDVKSIHSVNNDSNIYNEKKEKKNFYSTYSSPSIKRLCRKLNISILDIKGSGRKNRILKKDVQEYFSHLKKINLQNDDLKNIDKKGKTHSLSSREEIIYLSKIQQFSGSRLSENWKNIPHVTQFDKIDITSLENFRKKVNKNLNKKNIRLTLLPFIIKAISINLIKYKKFNSYLHKKKDRIILKKEINIGIAVNTENGIIVPVLKNVNQKTILEISSELISLSKKAQKNTLLIHEMKDSSFTISNLGGFGGMEFTPIINFPEVAILGVSRAKIEPLWKKNKFIPRLLLPISLSYDHRVIDGVDGALFIKNFNKNLKNFYKIFF